VITWAVSVSNMSIRDIPHLEIVLWRQANSDHEAAKP
jgi:hypothetical protein